MLLESGGLQEGLEGFEWLMDFGGASSKEAVKFYEPKPLIQERLVHGWVAGKDKEYGGARGWAVWLSFLNPEFRSKNFRLKTLILSIASAFCCDL